MFEKIVIFLFDLIFAVILIFVPETASNAAYLYLADVMVIVVVFLQAKKGVPDLPMLFFNITYFLFVLSGATSTIMNGGSLAEYSNTDNPDAIQTACTLAFLGIVVLNNAYYFFCGTKINLRINGQQKKEKNGSAPTDLQKLVLYAVFVISLICKFILEFESFTTSQNDGYLALYQTESSLPTFIQYPAALFYFALSLVLFSGISKKTTYFIFAIVAAMQLMILVAGTRAEAVCTVLFLVSYIVQKTRTDPDFLIHKKLALAVCLCALPFGIYILQLVKYTRMNESVSLSFFDTISEFFISQGGSFNILTWGVDMKKDVTELAGSNFILGSLEGYFKNNVFCRTLFGFEYLGDNTKAYALSGYSFGSTMSYLRFRESYLGGMGCGTVYLAELFHDYSWIGLILGSGFVSWLLSRLKELNKRGWIVSAILLNCLRSVFLMPRAPFFKFFTEIFAVPNLLLLALIVFAGLVSRPNYNNKKVSI